VKPYLHFIGLKTFYRVHYFFFKSFLRLVVWPVQIFLFENLLYLLKHRSLVLIENTGIVHFHANVFNAFTPLAEPVKKRVWAGGPCL
jgi:hypothetical protein